MAACEVVGPTVPDDWGVVVDAEDSVWWVEAAGGYCLRRHEGPVGGCPGAGHSTMDGPTADSCLGSCWAGRCPGPADRFAHSAMDACSAFAGGPDCDFDYDLDCDLAGDPEEIGKEQAGPLSNSTGPLFEPFAC